MQRYFAFSRFLIFSILSCTQLMFHLLISRLLSINSFLIYHTLIYHTCLFLRNIEQYKIIQYFKNNLLYFFFNRIELMIQACDVSDDYEQKVVSYVICALNSKLMAEFIYHVRLLKYLRLECPKMVCILI